MILRQGCKSKQLLQAVTPSRPPPSAYGNVSVLRLFVFGCTDVLIADDFAPVAQLLIAYLSVDYKPVAAPA